VPRLPEEHVGLETLRGVTVGQGDVDDPRPHDRVARGHERHLRRMEALVTPGEIRHEQVDPVTPCPVVRPGQDGTGLQDRIDEVRALERDLAPLPGTEHQWQLVESHLVHADVAPGDPPRQRGHDDHEPHDDVPAPDEAAAIVPTGRSHHLRGSRVLSACDVR
jgi:hypothetical protein